MTEKYIKALNELANPKFKIREDLLAWQGKVMNILNRKYGKDSIQEEQIKNISFKIYPSWHQNGVSGGGGNNLRNCELLASESIKGFVNDMETFELPEEKSSREIVKLDKIVKLKQDKKKVFIVHGHDDVAKTKTARFIQQLGLEPIILHEQASSSRTVIEKIEAYTNVGFGIVLYTPCDTGGKIETTMKYKNRARQNVVFEHGFLIGKIGRENVCALVKGHIETPNDISGVVYINMDEDEGWQKKLFKELKNSGYQVDANSFM